MNDHTETEGIDLANESQTPDDVEVAELMNLAGARPSISPDRQARVYKNVEQEWLRASARPRTMNWPVPLALAASLLIAVTVLINTGGAPAQELGTVARIVGGVPGQAQKLALHQIVHVGDTLRTTSSQAISVTLSHGSSLRLAKDTAIRLDHSRNFTLLHGLVYADSGQMDDRDEGLTIHTDLGSVTDVGTQFSVHYAENEIGVAVREGRVDIANDDASYSVMAGDKLTVQEDGFTRNSKVRPSDESWAWAVELAPDFEMESKSLLDFLDWAARETGKELIFTSSDARTLAKGTVLHGSVSGFTPIEAIQSVLATTSFDYDMDDKSLLIGI